MTKYSYQPAVSFVITTYGRADYLKDLINSVRFYTPNNTYEIVVVSSDPPESQKAQWLQKQKDVKVMFADVRRENEKRKKSLYYYTNLGIKQAKYPWILVMNDDMVVSPGWYTYFSKIVNNPKKQNVGMVIPATHIGDVKLGCRVAVIGKTKKPDQEWKDLYLADEAIIRKDVLEKIGYFDEQMDWFGSGADNALAVEFLTNTEIVIEDRIKITHFIAEEHRAANSGKAYKDFAYIKQKWDKWCQEHNCAYDCPLDTNPPKNSQVQSLISNILASISTIKTQLLKDL